MANSNTNDVQNSATQADMSDSSTEMEHSQSNESFDSEPSREDNNTPEENTGTEDPTYRDALNEVKADKSVNRVQQLANERNEYKTKWEEEKAWRSQEERKISQQLNQVPADSSTNETRMLLNEAKMYRLEEDRKWSEAVQAHPELEKDKDLDDLVYAQYVLAQQRGENITPKQVASRVINVLKKRQRQIENQAYEQAENDISEKMQNNKARQRTAQSNAAKAEQFKSDAIKRANEAGDWSGIEQMFTY